MSGNLPYDVLKMHKKYGPVVRVSPDELCFIGAGAWRDIYGHRKAGEAELPKDHKYHAGFDTEQLIMSADKDYHSQLRRLLSHGFSEKALREQETVLQEHVNLLMLQFQEKGKQGSVPVDLNMWYNVCEVNIPLYDSALRLIQALTFDVIGYLSTNAVSIYDGQSANMSSSIWRIL